MIDNSNIKMIGHVVIRDPDTNETFLKRRDVNVVPAVHEEIAPEHDDGAAADDGVTDYE